MNHFADRLFAAVRAKGTPLCVGLDPRWDSLPAGVRNRYPPTLSGRAAAFDEFCCRVLDVVAPLVGVVKPQSAFFEACGPAGMQALLQIVRQARSKGLLIILDAKRNDIASTAEAYAEAAFRVFDADALTINPYLGRDSVEPFLKVSRPLGRGLFVLVRTSNAGAGQFQDLACGGGLLYARVAAAVAAWGAENRGEAGYGDVGAVVGATNPAELAGLRRLLPGVPLLVPGYGAQGASAADTAGAFAADGLGAVVNSSRAILFPQADGRDWESAVEHACRRAVAELAANTPAGRLVARPETQTVAE
jgi:orotidine-5'-phosphate decarboxylase